MEREAADQRQFLLATSPPSQLQIRLAIGIVAVFAIAFAITAPFASIPLPRADGFIPALNTAVFINDMITSAILLTQFFVGQRWGLLVLASGFLYTALMAIPHALTFPGAFSPTGLLGAGLQTTAWLYTFWHAGLPLAVISYVLLRDAKVRRRERQTSPAAIIGWSVAAIFAIVCALTGIATAGEWLLPKLFNDSAQVNRLPAVLLGVSMMLLTGAALVLLWGRRRSVLDLWLTVMCCTLMFEVAMTMFVGSRFILSFYASRFFGVSATIIVLLVLLSETTALYAQFAHSAMREAELQRLEIARLMRQSLLGELAGAIAHELGQPLTAILSNAETAQELLGRSEIDRKTIQEIVADIIQEDSRASEVISRIRRMLRRGETTSEPVNLNALLDSTLHLLRGEIMKRKIDVAVEASGVPAVFGDPVQLQQVLLNVMMNAMDSMSAMETSQRAMNITTRSKGKTVEVVIRDSGHGVSAEAQARLFQPFFTTKAHGLGLGLTICSSIMRSHGGKLSIENSPAGGATVVIALPALELQQAG